MTELLPAPSGPRMTIFSLILSFHQVSCQPALQPNQLRHAAVQTEANCLPALAESDYSLQTRHAINFRNR
jgi:hypothetical protein